MPRRLLFPLFTLLAVLVLPGQASAVVTASKVMSPASTLMPYVNGDLPDTDPAYRVVMSGTAAGLPGDQVDLRCAYVQSDGTVNEDTIFPDGALVPVAPDGTFSREVGTLGQGGCRVVAVPAGVQPADVTPFAGPRYYGATRETTTIGGGPSAGALSNFFVGGTRPTLDADFTSIGGGGAPFDMTPVDDSGDLPRFSQELWYSNAALNAESAKAGETRSQVQVDGVNAFAPYAASRLYTGAGTASGLPSITIESVSDDQATGDVTHVSTEPIVSCPTTGGANVTASTANVTNCHAFKPSGVAVRRTVVLHVATRSIETKDRWVSTDGRAHDIDALYSQVEREVAPAQVGFRFPWVDGSAYLTRAAGAEIPPPPSRVSTLFVKTNAASGDDDPRYTQGSLTLSTKPDLIRFTDTDRFELGFRRTVPATGALPIDQRFTVGTKSAAVAAVAADMESRASSGLGVAITSATKVSGYDPAYTVSGTTTTQGGVKSLVVNGAPVTPGADGSWSAKVQLAPGANPLSATVTDNSGDSASAAGSVTFAPGPSQSALLRSIVRRGVLSATVRCQTLPGTTCSGRLKLTARVTRVKRTRHGRRRSTKTVTLATRSFKLPAGDRAVPTVRLGKATRKLVRKYHVKRATLTLTQTVGGVTKTTRSSVPVGL
jgi:hypothetical protein